MTEAEKALEEMPAAKDLLSQKMSDVDHQIANLLRRISAEVARGLSVTQPFVVFRLTADRKEVAVAARNSLPRKGYVAEFRSVSSHQLDPEELEWTVWLLNGKPPTQEEVEAFYKK